MVNLLKEWVLFMLICGFLKNQKRRNSSKCYSGVKPCWMIWCLAYHHSTYGYLMNDSILLQCLHMCKDNMKLVFKDYEEFNHWTRGLANVLHAPKKLNYLNNE